METKGRRRIEMGMRVLEFGRAHPEESPGYTAALTRLAERLARATELAAKQREGILGARAATERKDELRREMQASLLPHLVEAGKAAARDVPELAQKLVFRAAASSNLAFLTAARGMVAEVEIHRAVLERHGLATTVLDTLLHLLEQFGAAMELGRQSRQEHVEASAELRRVASEIVRIVRVMDGLNRYRFRHDPAALAAWKSASHVPTGPVGRKPAPEREDAPAPGGHERPAA